MLTDHSLGRMCSGGCVCTATRNRQRQRDDCGPEPCSCDRYRYTPKTENTPAPVEVVTANEIKKAGITDFQQAMTMLVPSLSFSTNSMGSYLMMNGLSNKYVLILINGRKLTGDISNNIDLSRIDMVA